MLMVIAFFVVLMLHHSDLFFFMAATATAGCYYTSAAGWRKRKSVNTYSREKARLAIRSRVRGSAGIKSTESS